jgi:hypothetical protein
LTHRGSSHRLPETVAIDDADAPSGTQANGTFAVVGRRTIAEQGIKFQVSLSADDHRLASSVNAKLKRSIGAPAVGVQPQQAIINFLKPRHDRVSP